MIPFISMMNDYSYASSLLYLARKKITTTETCRSCFSFPFILMFSVHIFSGKIWQLLYAIKKKKISLIWLSSCFHGFSKLLFTQLPNPLLYSPFKNGTYFLMDQKWKTWMQISILNLKYKSKLPNTYLD